jgi:hypothetical protein
MEGKAEGNNSEAEKEIAQKEENSGARDRT